MAYIGEIKLDDLPKSDFELLPAGKYQAMIVSSEEKATKAGTGKYIQLELVIQGGEYSGRKLTERLNISNPSETAVKIAFQTLRKILQALNMVGLKDSEEFHGKLLVIGVGVEAGSKYTDKYGAEKDGNPQNTITGYYPLSEATGARAQEAAPVAAPAVAAAGGAPWKK